MSLGCNTSNDLKGLLSLGETKIFLKIIIFLLDR